MFKADQEAMTEEERSRHQRMLQINDDPCKTREEAEKRYGQVWDAGQFRQQFTVEGFLAPFIAVRRVRDGVKGIMEFQHCPRVHFNWVPYSEASEGK